MGHDVALRADVQLLAARDGATGLEPARHWMPNLILPDQPKPPSPSKFKSELPRFLR